MTNITHGMQGITYNVKFAFKGMSMTKHSQVQNISAYSEYTKTAINLFQILNNFLVNHILYITYTRFEQLRHIIFQRHKNNQTTNKGKIKFCPWDRNTFAPVLYAFDIILLHLFFHE